MYVDWFENLLFLKNIKKTKYGAVDIRDIEDIFLQIRIKCLGNNKVHNIVFS